MARIVLVSQKMQDFWYIRRYLLVRLIQSGQEVIIIAPGDHTRLYLERIGCIVIGISSDLSIALVIRLLKENYRLSFKLAIVYGAHLNALLGAFRFLSLSLKVVSVLHDLYDHMFRLDWFTKCRGLPYFLWRYADAVLFYSRSHAKAVLDHRYVSKRAIRLVPGEGLIIPDDFLVEPAVPCRFLLICDSSDPTVSLLPYILASRALKRVYAEIECRIVLIGNVAAQLLWEKHYESLLRDSSVMWLGVVNDLETVIQEVHVIVSTSAANFINMPIIQAMSYAKPLLAPIQTAYAPLFSNDAGVGYNNSDPEALAKAMQDFFCMEPFIRRQMGKKAQDFVLRLHAGEKIFQVYRSILNELGLGIFI